MKRNQTKQQAREWRAIRREERKVDSNKVSIPLQDQMLNLLPQSVKDKVLIEVNKERLTK